VDLVHFITTVVHVFHEQHDPFEKYILNFELLFIWIEIALFSSVKNTNEIRYRLFFDIFTSF